MEDRLRSRGSFDGAGLSLDDLLRSQRRGLSLAGLEGGCDRTDTQLEALTPLDSVVKGGALSGMALLHATQRSLKVELK